MMRPLRVSENTPELAIMTKGHRSWFCFKFVKYIIILLCTIMLPVNQRYSGIEDDFTPAYKVDDTYTTTPTVTEPVTIATSSVKYRDARKRILNLDNVHLEHKTILRLKRGPDNNSDTNHDHDFPNTRLSDLLIMYPCCTTVIIILGMEMLGEALGDPLGKFTVRILRAKGKLGLTNLVLILLCIVLSLVAFLVSLLAAIRTVQTTMIIISVLSVLFFLLEIVDFVLLFLS